MDTLLAAVFERLPLPIVIIDGDGRVLAANPSALRLDVVPARPAPSQLADLMHEKGWIRAGAEGTRDAWPLPLDTAHSFRPVTFTRHTGEAARRLDATITPLDGGARKAVAVVAFMEVAGRHPGARRDRTIEDKYRLLFEHSPDGIFLSRQDGTILAANPAVCELLGRTEEEFCAIGRGGILVHDGALARALFERRTSGRVRADLTYLHKDGRPVIGDTTSVVIPGTGPEPDALTIVRDATEQRRAEDAVRERNDYIETVLENAPIGFAVNTIDDGKARFVSGRFEEVYGLPKGSLASVDDFFDKVFRDPGYRAQVRARMLADMATGDPSRMRWEELQTTTADGETRFVTAVNIPLPDRNLMVSTAQDVTDRVLAQVAAREKSADLDRYFDLASDLLVICDMEGRFHRVNRGWTAAIGWSIDDLTSRPFMDFVHPDDVEATRGAMEALRHGRAVSHFVNRYRCRDGSYRWLEWRAAAHDGRWVFGVGRDITDRRKQEEALQHSETRFEGLVEAANDAIFVQADGRFVYVNEAALRLFGADAGRQLIGEPVLDRFHPDCRGMVAERIRLLNERRMPVPLLEETCLRLDGTPVPAEVAAAPIVYEGRPGAVVVARDITARKKLEAQLVQAQRMESVGRLAGGVAHDFNNMLSIIMGYAELRLSMTAPSDPARDDLEEILAAARKSADLTRQLLAFARRQTIRPQVLDLNACVGSTLKMLQRLVGEDINVRWHPAEDLWPVSIDPSQVDQILANLVVNSRDAMPQGGLITIDTINEHRDEAFSLRHAGAVPGDYVRLTVSDTGTGMPGTRPETGVRAVLHDEAAWGGNGPRVGHGLRHRPAARRLHRRLQRRRNRDGVQAVVPTLRVGPGVDPAAWARRVHAAWHRDRAARRGRGSHPQARADDAVDARVRGADRRQSPSRAGACRQLPGENRPADHRRHHAGDERPRARGSVDAAASRAALSLHLWLHGRRDRAPRRTGSWRAPRPEAVLAARSRQGCPGGAGHRGGGTVESAKRLRSEETPRPAAQTLYWIRMLVAGGRCAWVVRALHGNRPAFSPVLRRSPAPSRQSRRQREAPSSCSIAPRHGHVVAWCARDAPRALTLSLVVPKQGIMDTSHPSASDASTATAHVLVLNCGSSSAKFAVIDPADSKEQVSGIAQRLGSPEASLDWKRNGSKQSRPIPGADHDAALRMVGALLNELGLADGLLGVGHRVVHGGSKFSGSMEITPEVVAKVVECVPLGPLHNPPNLLGIRIAQELFPSTPQVAVFDTAFHQSMPPVAYTYPVPYEWLEGQGVRRYGFHGTSHRFVARQTLHQTGLPADDHAIVTAHLGNGCSCTAVRNGKSVDTTMGLTPLEGVMMGTRSGSVDPAIIGHVANALGKPEKAILDALNKESGLLGVSGLSNDMRTVEDAAAGGHTRAALALDIFCYVLAKSLASLVVPLGRLDALAFTGGIGENSTTVRRRVVEHLGFLGLTLDTAANDVHGRQTHGRITKELRPQALVVPTNEELMIALDTADIARRG